MQHTRLRLLVAIALVAAVVGWILATISDSLFGRYLPVPWSAAVAVWFLAVALAMWAWIVRPRLLRKPGTLPLPPYVAARTAALALAASRVGAGVAGVYIGVAVTFLPELRIPAAQQGALTAAVTALGGVAMAVVAMWLEHMCRITENDDDEGDPTTDPSLRGIAGSAERTSA